MSDLDRRTFLTTVSMAGLTSLAPTGAAAAGHTGRGECALPPLRQASPEPWRGMSCRLAMRIFLTPVRKEARRTLLNWVGCAVGGSRHETVDIAIAALAPFSGPAQASVLGRRERLDILHAALMNGISSHVFDFDDTHLKTVIHPAGPVVSAILALAEHRPMSGRDFLTAMVVGIEAECRIGNAVYPAHYDRGWHITGTAGVFGAAAACGTLPGPDRAADGLGAWSRRDAAGRPARDVRHDDEELPSRPCGAEWADRGAARVARTSPAPMSRSRARAGGPTC